MKFNKTMELEIDNISIVITPSGEGTSTVSVDVTTKGIELGDDLMLAESKVFVVNDTAVLAAIEQMTDVNWSIG